jgi:hypothetical protein
MVRLLPAHPEDDYALQPGVLEAAIQEDIAAGLLPFYVVATIGTTSSCAVDPVSALGRITMKYNIWCPPKTANQASFACVPVMLLLATLRCVQCTTFCFTECCHLAGCTLMQLMQE